ncbi:MULTISPECIES: ferredoxin [unclassified Mycolicibacterium]|uniref:ferredoxin n=1 Tax=unclassified Mycolicibacterium TaxID=2636767 RepID=UPI0012DD5698|nr:MULTISPECIES: ferredoxin [unclassified Mycolicibacterium]MUL82320.1 ferredoxin [Mycolicibacterium sp. CBMA 329]MUL88086.1 ferredoxin [Mycolicibacterium sp. CBMA 331]MUM02416.1 ferredoxin [Mycolicibacterium sp. CBMA 334]MUM24819.1 ferredoxin [Mycolicibacterium sp. CBMA 295]MUM38383.1 ferredoxin [Mycolicibacterium sp. CBMA 247]
MPHHLRIDRRACAGHGLCYGAAPEILDCDIQGDPVILEDPIPDHQLDSARHVVAICPERALDLGERELSDG